MRGIDRPSEFSDSVDQSQFNDIDVEMRGSSVISGTAWKSFTTMQLHRRGPRPYDWSREHRRLRSALGSVRSKNNSFYRESAPDDSRLHKTSSSYRPTMM